MAVQRPERPQGPAHRWRAPTFAEEYRAAQQPAAGDPPPLGSQSPASPPGPPSSGAQDLTPDEDIVFIAIHRSTLATLIQQEIAAMNQNNAANNNDKNDKNTTNINTGADAANQAPGQTPSREELLAQQRRLEEQLGVVNEQIKATDKTGVAEVVQQGKKSGWRNVAKATGKIAAGVAAAGGLVAGGVYLYRKYKEAQG